MSESGEDVLYCICQKPYKEAVFMIECDVCKDWFHGECVSIKERQAVDIDTYHCPECQKTHGPLILKRRRSRKKFAPQYSDDLEHFHIHDVKCGTVDFANALLSRTFPSSDRVIKKLKGHMLDREYIDKNGFKSPIIIKDKAGLDLKVPDPSFTVDDVEIAVGSMREVDVIDVAKQSDMKMLMREFVEYYNNKNRDRILNVISLEFSNTKLAELVTPPRIISELSWVSNFWPESTGDVRTFVRPEVQKYCLMSVKDSYTDFHIDFGGTSVWYHVIRGAKIFYLIEPTNTNLALYETWSNSSAQNTIFFGDQVKACYKVHLKPGNTLFIPTGWIHSVLTPEDSLVFGGNFIHSYNIKLQLEVYAMEKRLGTPDKFSFPNLETLYWYAAKNLTDILRGALDGGKRPCQAILDGCAFLRDTLSAWMGEKDGRAISSTGSALRRHRDCLPDGISHVKIVKELTQFINELTLKFSPKKIKQAGTQPSLSTYTKVRKRQAPLKVRAKRRANRTSLDGAQQMKKDSSSITEDFPEQKELREDKSHQSNATTSQEKPRAEVEISADSDRATLLGLKFKLNRTQGSIKPEPMLPGDAALSDGSESGSDDNVVVDDPPLQPTETLKKYRFSLGGKNINDLSSASDEVLSSDANRSPTKSAPTPPSNHQNLFTWSKGIENLVKATTTQSATLDSRDNKVRTMIGMHRKERQGTKLARPVATNSRVEKEETALPPVETQKPLLETTSCSDEDAMEKRLKSCYTDDTYVYPALADSDYDDESDVRPLKKRKTKDDSWHPNSMSSKSKQLIREKRPSRDHAVKPSVKAELEMTREYLKDRTHPTHKQKRSKMKKRKHRTSSMKPPPSISNGQDEDSCDESSLVMSIPSTSMDHGYHLPPPTPPPTLAKQKIRKSGTTVKQRLGKLLKLY